MFPKKILHVQMLTNDVCGWKNELVPEDTQQYPYRSFCVLSAEQNSDVNYSVYLYEQMSGKPGPIERHYIATQDWVNTQISGAISASY